MNLALLQLSDSALPIGGYSHSWGLEAAVDRGLVTDPSTLEAWTLDWLRFGLGPFEGVVVAAVCRDVGVLAQANEMLDAGIAVPTLRNASRDMGRQLLALAEVWPWAERAVTMLAPAPSPPGTPGGEGWGEEGRGAARGINASQGISTPSPPTPLPRSTGGEGRKTGGEGGKTGNNQVPKLKFVILIQGLMLMAIGWSLMGLSLWAGHAAVADSVPELSFASWAYYCASIAMAYVLGFVVFTNPGGIGVREWALCELLTADKKSTIVVAVLLLRIVWTATELIVAGLLFVWGRASKLARIP